MSVLLEALQRVERQSGTSSLQTDAAALLSVDDEGTRSASRGVGRTFFFLVFLGVGLLIGAITNPRFVERIFALLSLQSEPANTVDAAHEPQVAVLSKPPRPQQASSETPLLPAKSLASHEAASQAPSLDTARRPVARNEHQASAATSAPVKAQGAPAPDSANRQPPIVLSEKPAKRTGSHAAESSAQPSAQHRPVPPVPLAPALKIAPSASQRYQDAWRAWEAGRLAEALSLLDQLLSQQPQYRPAHLLRILVQDALGAHEAARQALAALEAAANDPLDPTLVETRARLLLRAGDVAAAVAHLELGIKRHPDALPLWSLLGVTALARNDAATAQRAYAHLLTQQPEERRWWLGLAAALEQQGKHQEARRVLQRAGAWAQ